MLGARQGGGGERGEGRGGITKLSSWPLHCTHPGWSLQSSEPQSMSFNAPDHLGVMEEEIIQRRKEHPLPELCGSGKPEEWPRGPLCSLRIAYT